MDKAVVLQQNEILCASGTLKSASETILSGKAAICKGPFFDIDTVCAPFPDRSWATLSGSVHALKSLCGKLPEGPGVLFIYAAAKGDIGPIEKGNDIPHALLDYQARKVAGLLGIRPSRIMVVSSACASGAIAVQTAKEMLEREMFGNVVIFGYDVISRFVVSGFHSLNALSSKEAKPFDKSRDGLNLGDGAALSVLKVVGKPIKFVGTGEKLDNLEPFYPERIASRIVGMGDILTLVEKAEQEFDQKEAEALEEKIRKNQFTFDDFLAQLRTIRKMGSLRDLLGMLPGMDKAMKNVNIDDKAFSKVEAIILSMTPKERSAPKIINGSRRIRIAKGSGTTVQDVNKLLKQFEEMQKLMKSVALGKRSKFLPNLPFGVGGKRR